MKKTIKSICFLLTVICTLVFSICVEMKNNTPDEFIVNNEENFSFSQSQAVSFRKNKNEITVNSNLRDSYESGQLMLMNIIPVKDVNLHIQEKKYVVPCGNIFGIKFYTKGAIIIKCSDILNSSGYFNPGKDSGLKEGDIITKVNGEKILTCEEVSNAVRLSDGNPISLTYDRQGSVEETTIKPVQTGNNEYELGLWIRDSCAGLGTMTFYDPDSGCFASLGHGICDNDTGNLMPLDKAIITNAEISSITKGSNGAAGTINGYFSDDESPGYALSNAETGLYGFLSSCPEWSEPVEIANIQDVKKGPAKIMCTLDNDGVKYYDIEITHVDYDENNKTKNLQIIATDERLLSKTGGIIRGMSGSPILQNGKLIGAVTHVLVTNSSKGYGIFAQNMYTEMETCLIKSNKITNL